MSDRKISPILIGSICELSNFFSTGLTSSKQMKLTRKYLQVSMPLSIICIDFSNNSLLILNKVTKTNTQSQLETFLFKLKNLLISLLSQFLTI